VHEVAAATPRAPASPVEAQAAKAARPALATPRTRRPEPPSLEVPGASNEFGGLTAAARSPSQGFAAGGAHYEAMLVLLLGTLGAAAVWSYAAARPRKR
jgi:hypothetical protein